MAANGSCVSRPSKREKTHHPVPTVASQNARVSRTEVVVVGEGVRFARLVASDTLFDAVSGLVAHVESSGVSIQEVRTQACGVLSCTDWHDVYYTNICGKLDHYEVCSILRDEVMVYAKDHSDAFGNALCVFSPLCSLRISKAMTNTLYRGATCSTHIAHVLEHAIRPETIRNNSVHMIVASARLGHPVLMHHDFLASKLDDNRLWTCTRHINDGEMQKYHSVRLSDFDGTWLTRCGLEDTAVPQSCLVNVCRTGTINMFVSISPGVSFAVGIEHRYTAMLRVVVAAVAAAT